MFVRAEGRKDRSVVYHSKDGSRLVRHSGTRAWRNNNPGNIRSGKFANSNGAIGEAGGFAVFPDYETGRRTLARLLRTGTYRGLSIRKAVERYAPHTENDTANYQRLIRKIVKVDLERKLGGLPTPVFQRLLDAIQRIEGWKEGREERTSGEKIIDVERNKRGAIDRYLLQRSGWFSKAALIQKITTEGGVDAVVVRRAGLEPYIRTRPDRRHRNNLESLG